MAEAQVPPGRSCFGLVMNKSGCQHQEEVPGDWGLIVLDLVFLTSALGGAELSPNLVGRSSDVTVAAGPT